MPFQVVPPGTNIDFVGHRKLAGAVSIALIVASFAAVAVRGVQLGIDFAGGTELQVSFEEGVPAREGPIRDALGSVGLTDASVVRFGEAGANEFLIRFQREGPEGGGSAAFLNTLHEALREHVGPLEEERERVEYVGPRVGAELRRDGLTALGVAALVILIYVGFRFTPRFAPGAIAALVHDVVITSGIFVILGLEFDLRVLAALLAIVGYSLNDTIIVYDRIRENLALHTKVDLPDVVNRSINQTLSRTILTSGTTLLAVLSLLFLGGEVIRSFSLAMTIGILVGTYSSVYIAAPMLLLLEGRFGESGAAGARPAPARDATPARARRRPGGNARRRKKPAAR